MADDTRVWSMIHTERAAVAGAFMKGMASNATTTNKPPAPAVAMLGEIVVRAAPSLLLAMTGGRAGLDSLSGDGVAVMRDRMS